MFLKHLNRTKKLLERIADAKEAGQPQEVRKRLRRYIESYGPKLLSVVMAMQKREMPVTYDKAHKIAREICPWIDCGEPIRHTEIPKHNGMRPIVRYGIKRNALQLMVLNGLMHCHGDEITNYAIFGGPHAALEAAENLVIKEECTHFVTCDIKSFYSSISHDAVENMLCLKHSVTKTVVLNSNYGINEDNLVPGKSEVQRGLPQGSASSSFVAALSLMPILESVQHLGRVVVFNDDILIGCYSLKEAKAIKNALNSALQNSPVGPLTPKYLYICTLDQGFDFLKHRFGYRPELFGGEFFIKANGLARDDYIRRLLFKLLNNPRRYGDSEIAIQYLDRWLSHYKFWDRQIGESEWLFDITKEVLSGAKEAKRHRAAIAKNKGVDILSLPALTVDDFNINNHGVWLDNWKGSP